MNEKVRNVFAVIGSCLICLILGGVVGFLVGGRNLQRPADPADTDQRIERAVAWEERDPQRHSELYMRCFADGLEVPGLTQDAGWFVNLFCRMLWAQRAFIEQLQSRLIILENGGRIQSKNWDDGEGFMIDGDTGNAVFNQLTARGDSYFEGDIRSGLFYSSNQLTGEDQPDKIFSAGQTAKDVYDYYGDGDRNVAGSFGTNSVYHLHLSWSWVPDTSSGIAAGGMTKLYSLEMASPSGTIERVWSENRRNNLGESLIIAGGRRGAIFRFIGLPDGSAGLQRGDVYTDGVAGYVRIKT